MKLESGLNCFQEDRNLVNGRHQHTKLQGNKTSQSDLFVESMLFDDTVNYL